MILKADTPRNAKHVRNLAIINLYQAGYSSLTIAKMMNVSASRITKILRDYRQKYVSPYIYLEDYDLPPTPENMLPR